MNSVIDGQILIILTNFNNQYINVHPLLYSTFLTKLFELIKKKCLLKLEVIEDTQKIYYLLNTLRQNPYVKNIQFDETIEMSVYNDVYLFLEIIKMYMINFQEMVYLCNKGVEKYCVYVYRMLGEFINLSKKYNPKINVQILSYPDIYHINNRVLELFFELDNMSDSIRNGYYDKVKKLFENFNDM
jgi:hypothetical protein